MKVLLIGQGGRDHTIAWKLSQSPNLEQLYVAPGNGGTSQLPRTRNISIATNDILGLRNFAVREAIDLSIVGPADPLVRGIVDLFQENGLKIFGPSQAAAQLEGSKAFARHFMERHGIPTAAGQTFSTYRDAQRHLMMAQTIPVVKASGLAGGKGVFVPSCFADAEAALHTLMVEKRFGEAGQTVIIEEMLSGPELTLLMISDGQDYLLMPAAQDYKRLHDQGQGPNTGGMGAFAPSPLATPSLLAQIEETVIRPVLDGLAQQGTPFVGVLYAGLMLTDDGPKVLEWNARFGDPETQAILPLLESDLLELFVAAVEGRLRDVTPRWRDEVGAAVVMASGGYPGRYETGYQVRGLEEAAAVPGCIPFHAGTSRRGDDYITTGGRVLSVSATAPTLQNAVERAYQGVRSISFRDAHFRSDIGRDAAK